jgi:hypothetical protein
MWGQSDGGYSELMIYTPVKRLTIAASKRRLGDGLFTIMYMTGSPFKGGLLPLKTHIVHATRIEFELWLLLELMSPQLDVFTPNSQYFRCRRLAHRIRQRATLLPTRMLAGRVHGACRVAVTCYRFDDWQML